MLALAGWVTGLLAYVTGEAVLPCSLQLSYILPVFTCSTVGNFASFFEVGIAAHLDEKRNLHSIVPALAINFVVMDFCRTKALLDLIAKRDGKHVWNHTNHNGSGRNNRAHIGNGSLRNNLRCTNNKRVPSVD